MSRASFGWGPQSMNDNGQQPYKESEKVIPLEAVEKPTLDPSAHQALKNDSSRKEVMKELFEKSRQGLMKVNLAWMDKLYAEPSLRERMTFFWHNHFACRTLVPFFAQQQNNTIRSSALGTFGELLMAISKDPAMLQFLNNQQNKKDHPNENFAREVMELFTLGRGNYSEQDVREAARAFTGWGFNLQGEFQFRQRQHDFGTKTFRGVSKDFTGEQIIDSILGDQATAKFITRKLYQSFVSDQNIPTPVVDEWANSFYQSGYDIKKLMHVIFQSEEFNSPVNVGNRIKSPAELLIGMQLHTNGKFENPQSLIFLQRAMRQVLFYPPNVSGWPKGKEWIDSTSLTFRLTLPMLLFGGLETDFEASDDGDANGLGKDRPGKRNLHCKADWIGLANQFTKASASETVETIEEFLLSRKASSANRDLVSKRAGLATNGPEFMKALFIGFMSLPEYQMC